MLWEKETRKTGVLKRWCWTRATNIHTRLKTANCKTICEKQSRSTLNRRLATLQFLPMTSLRPLPPLQTNDRLLNPSRSTTAQHRSSQTTVQTMPNSKSHHIHKGSCTRTRTPTKSNEPKIIIVCDLSFNFLWRIKSGNDLKFKCISISQIQIMFQTWLVMFWIALRKWLTDLINAFLRPAGRPQKHLNEDCKNVKLAVSTWPLHQIECFRIIDCTVAMPFCNPILFNFEPDLFLLNLINT